MFYTIFLDAIASLALVMSVTQSPAIFVKPSYQGTRYSLSETDHVWPGGLAGHHPRQGHCQEGEVQGLLLGLMSTVPHLLHPNIQWIPS